MEKLESGSLDITKLNIEKIKELFPNCVTEGKINFDILKVLLGEEIDDSKEKYQFTWSGKAKAIKISQSPSTSTLRPLVNKSKKWNSTKNLYIEGDNLEALKQLQKTYYGKIKAIYIDPPYNTGKDFVYKDNFDNSVSEYKKITNQLLTSNPETNGRFHSDWLNMMYPRLLLAKNLLSDDGVIFISIDENEMDNLKKLGNEVFGETNYSATFLWTKTSTPPALSNKCRKTVEYVFAFEKKISNQKYYGSPLDGGDAPLLNTGNPIKILSFPSGSVRFGFIENGTIPSGQKEKSELLNDVIVKNGVNSNSFSMQAEFKWEQNTLNDEINKGTYFKIKSDKFSIRFQRTNLDDSFKTPNNNLNIELNKEGGVGTNETAVKELSQMGFEGYFDYAKPVSLIKFLIKMICKNDKESIILDFFSGSGTTAEAVMELNNEDNGSRSFIMVQLPELYEKSSLPFENGFKTICDLGEERIRRAGEQIKKEWIEKNKGEGIFEEEKEFPYDIGFKVFKLDSTNIKAWDSESKYDETSLFSQQEVFKEGRTKEDVLYEIMLKYGLFDMQANEVDVNGKTMYRVGKRHMLVCLEDGITEQDVKAIGELSPRVVVFKESGFNNDNDKVNAVYNLNKAGVEEVKSI